MAFEGLRVGGRLVTPPLLLTQTESRAIEFILKKMEFQEIPGDRGERLRHHLDSSGVGLGVADLYNENALRDLEEGAFHPETWNRTAEDLFPAEQIATLNTSDSQDRTVLRLDLCLQNLELSSWICKVSQRMFIPIAAI